MITSSTCYRYVTVIHDDPQSYITQHHTTILNDPQSYITQHHTTILIYSKKNTITDTETPPPFEDQLTYYDNKDNVKLFTIIRSYVSKYIGPQANPLNTRKRATEGWHSRLGGTCWFTGV